MLIPDEEDLLADIIDLFGDAIPAIQDGIQLPTDEIPQRTSALVYFGPHTILWHIGFEELQTQITLQICEPKSGPYQTHARSVTQAANAVYEQSKAGIRLMRTDLLISAPVTIGQTGYGLFQPGNIGVVSAAVTFSAELKQETNFYE